MDPREGCPFEDLSQPQAVAHLIEKASAGALAAVDALAAK